MEDCLTRNTMNLFIPSTNLSTVQPSYLCDSFENEIKSCQIVQHADNLNAELYREHYDGQPSGESTTCELYEHFHELPAYESPSSKTSKDKESFSEASSEASINTSPEIIPKLNPRARTCFTVKQVLLLEKEYAKGEYVSKSRRAALSEELELPENTVKVWFQNRRMKSKRQKRESKFRLLPPNPMDLLVYPSCIHPLQFPDTFPPPPSVIYPSVVYSPYHTDYNYHEQHYVTTPEKHTPPESSAIQPETQELNCCKSCSERYFNTKENLPDVTNTPSQPFSSHLKEMHISEDVELKTTEVTQLRHTSTEIHEHFPRQSEHLFQEFGRETIPLGDFQTQNHDSESTNHSIPSNTKSGRSKFFRPFEDN